MWLVQEINSFIVKAPCKNDNKVLHKKWICFLQHKNSHVCYVFVLNVMYFTTNYSLYKWHPIALTPCYVLRSKTKHCKLLRWFITKRKKDRITVLLIILITIYLLFHETPESVYGNIWSWSILIIFQCKCFGQKSYTRAFTTYRRESIRTSRHQPSFLVINEFNSKHDNIFQNKMML